MQRFAPIALLMGVLVACAGPRGVLGVQWDMPADAAAEILGLRCDAWKRLPDMPEYENCLAESADIWQLPVRTVALARRNGRLAGIIVWFERCDMRAVRARLVRELDLDAQAGEYWSWPNGQIVRLRKRPAGACKLVVTDADFGKVYARWLVTASYPNPWH